MSQLTNTCPTWCAWQASELHLEGDLLAADDSTILRTHARTVGSMEIAGQGVDVDLTQEETVRYGTAEFGPLTVYVGEIEPMTAAEARALATLLVTAAEQLEATR